MQYDRAGWNALPLVGRTTVAQYREIETLRNCPCKSTLMVVECLDCGVQITADTHDCIDLAAQ